MTIDDVARSAATELREVIGDLEPPIASSGPDRGRLWPALGLAAVVIVIGLVVVIRRPPVTPAGEEVEVGQTAPTSTIASATSASLSEGVGPVGLLDGSTLQLAGVASLVVDRYQFFMEFVALDERFVTLTPDSTPLAVAESESAQLAREISETATVWVAPRQGRPVFLAIESGTWVTWLNVGNDELPPSDQQLTLAVDLLDAAVGPDGIQLATPPDVYELLLSGDDGGAVTIRFGACYGELVPDAVQGVHSVRGPYVDGQSYVSWCEPGLDIEVIAEGSPSFVDHALENFQIDVLKG